MVRDEGEISFRDLAENVGPSLTAAAFPFEHRPDQSWTRYRAKMLQKIYISCANKMKIEDTTKVVYYKMYKIR